jgi:hypothetical protein
MAALLRKNFSRGVLAVDLTVIATQLVMKAGHNLPVAAGTFPLVIWDFEASPDPADALDLEIVLASYSGVANKYNITRAQEGTFALIHHIDDRVALHYTAEMSRDDMKHSNLDELAYANAGHTGFQEKLDYDNILGCYLVES